MGMKRFFQRSFRTFLSLAALQWSFPGFEVGDKIYILILAALLLTAINILVRPFLKLIFLPLNLISFGLFGWVINVFSLLILTFLMDEVKFIAFQFLGLNYAGFTIPPISFSALGSLIVGSFLLSFIRRIIYKLLVND